MSREPLATPPRSTTPALLPASTNAAPRVFFIASVLLLSLLFLVGTASPGIASPVLEEPVLGERAPDETTTRASSPHAAELTATTLDEIRRRGTLRYTSVPEQMNAFVSLDLEVLQATGEKQGKGIDPTLVGMLAEHLGVELELVLPREPTLPEMWACLEESRAEIAVGGLSILPGRAERFDFSESYYQTDLAVVGRPGSPWQTIDEIRSRSQALIPEASAATHWLKVAEPDGKIVEAEFSIGVVSHVAEGRADIGIDDVALVRSYVESLDDVEILFTVPVDDHYGIAFQKGSELVPLMNEILQKLKESGELQQILDRYKR